MAAKSPPKWQRWAARRPEVISFRNTAFQEIMNLQMRPQNTCNISLCRPYEGHGFKPKDELKKIDYWNRAARPKPRSHDRVRG
jgi:hypothetical protein